MTERDEARFWAKVALPNEQGCMLWLASKLPNGYGRLHLSGQVAYAHRVSYELAYGRIPAGLQIDHLCRVRHCVAPFHLEAVTQQENMRRGAAGQHNAAKTCCPQGHPYEGANLYAAARGDRQCRLCKNASSREAHRKRRAAS
jgi:hypothetical protein